MPQKTAVRSTTEPVIDNSEMTPQPLSASSLRAPNGSLWQRLRDQRREVAAVVALIVMAIIWFDTGSSRGESNSVSLDPLEGYEAVLSDFSTVDDDRPLRESADPFESPSQSMFDGGLSIPQSSESAESSTATTDNFPAVTRGTIPSGKRELSGRVSSRSTPRHGGPATRNASEQQSGRRVRFAGRIQPTH